MTDNGFFFVIKVFFSFLGDNKAQKKTFIKKKKPLSQYFAKFRVHFGQFWAKKRYIIFQVQKRQFLDFFKDIEDLINDFLAFIET